MRKLVVLQRVVTEACQLHLLPEPLTVRSGDVCYNKQDSRVVRGFLQILHVSAICVNLTIHYQEFSLF